MTPVLDFLELMAYFTKTVLYYEVTSFKDIGTFRIIDPLVVAGVMAMLIDIYHYVLRGPGHDN